MKISFEYCSLHYLNWWLSHDMICCQAFDKGDKAEKLNALKEVAAHYSIARNLPTEFDLDKGFARYEPILNIIDALPSNTFESHDIVAKITEIEGQISKVYGGDKKLSLTTKFLWMKFKHPVVIYDAMVRTALDTNDGDLEVYYEKWREQFAVHKKEIVAACAQLASVHQYAANQEIGTKEYIDQISSEQWFHERVLDTYLWHMEA